MKVLIWIGVAVIALLWTGGIALLAETLQWAAQRVSSGSMATLEAANSNIVIPMWLAPWLDASGWASLLQATQGILNSVSITLPALGTMVGWLVPAVWILWGLGMAILLSAAVIGTIVSQRFRRSR